MRIPDQDMSKETVTNILAASSQLRNSGHARVDNDMSSFVILRISVTTQGWQLW